MYAVNMRGDLLDEHKTERERERERMARSISGTDRLADRT